MMNQFNPPVNVINPTSNCINSQVSEEITTIFVVGFPDDMQDREFQNMFTFSPGFEAATLKIPSSALSEDDNGLGRKQIIGFAKFRTRMEALEARDILNGRRIDAEKGCMLKAEMAKKNLHTRRATTQDYTTLLSNNMMGSYGLHPSLYRNFTSRREYETIALSGTYENGGFDGNYGYPVLSQLEAGHDAMGYGYHGTFETEEEPFDTSDQLGVLDQLSRSCISEILDDPGVQAPISKPSSSTTSMLPTLPSSLPSPVFPDLFSSHGGDDVHFFNSFIISYCLYDWVLNHCRFRKCCLSQSGITATQHGAVLELWEIVNEPYKQHTPKWNQPDTPSTPLTTITIGVIRPKQPTMQYALCRQPPSYGIGR